MNLKVENIPRAYTVFFNLLVSAILICYYCSNFFNFDIFSDLLPILGLCYNSFVNMYLLISLCV
jgi:hypothetical protein